MTPHEFQCFGPLGFSAYYLSTEILPNWCVQALGASIIKSPVGLLNYAKYFSLTVILESFLYLPGLRFFGVGLKRSIGILIFGNLCTHPVVFFIFPIVGHFFEISYIHTITVAEIFAVLVEAVVIYFSAKQLRFKLAFLVSAVANMTSWGVGLFLLATINAIA